MLEIRPARRDDMVFITEIWNEVIRTSTATFNDTEKTLGEVTTFANDRQVSGEALLVAVAHGTVCGFGSTFPFRGGRGYRHTLEHTIHLAPAHRRMGLGRHLLAALEEHARAAGAHSLIAGVSGENAGGRAFHLRMGYTERACLPQVGFKFGRWFDLILMQKFL